jgi:hypothetical protein
VDFTIKAKKKSCNYIERADFKFNAEPLCKNVKVIYDGSKVAIQTKKTKKRKLDKTYIGENGVEIVSFGA